MVYLNEDEVLVVVIVNDSIEGFDVRDALAEDVAAADQALADPANARRIQWE